MDSHTLGDRIEIYGHLSEDILNELAAEAVIDGVSIKPGGPRCEDVSEIVEAARQASAAARALVLYSTSRVTSFAGMEDVLTCYHVSHQIVAPFRANDTDFQARHYDGLSMRFRKVPMESAEPFSLEEGYSVTP